MFNVLLLLLDLLDMEDERMNIGKVELNKDIRSLISGNWLDRNQL